MRQTFSSETTDKIRSRRRIWLGIGLIVVGGVALLATLNPWSWLRWGVIWPVPVILIGILVLLLARKK